MPILDAAVAFAVTMMLVATAATQIVSVLKNTASLRCEELKKMIQVCFDKEIAPVVTRESKRLMAEVDEKVAGIVASLADKFQAKDLIEDIDENDTGWLSTEEFIEYLKKSEEGGELLETLGDKAQTVFDEMGKRYEAVGRQFSEDFKKRSRFWSTAAALVLAVVLNIDSVHIASTYIENPAQRAAVIAQVDDVIANYQAGLEPGEQPEVGTAEALKLAVEQSRSEIAKLQQSSLPVGWSIFPHSSIVDHGGIATLKAMWSLDGLSWLIGIALTGLLAGLGSPFWYDAIRGISRTAQKVGGPKSSEQ